MNVEFYYRDGAREPDWQSRESAVVANPELARQEPALLDRIRRRLPGLEAHVWVATSGSSADPASRIRWVALSKEAFLVSAAAVNRHLDVTASDVWAHALPCFHVGGLAILARAWLSGVKVVATIDGRWQPGRYRDRIVEAGATLSALVPAQVHDLVEAHLEAPPPLRAIVVGGGALEPSLFRKARTLGWRCLPSYGLTETCSQVATASPASLDSDQYPAALPVLSHAQVRCNDDQRLEVRAGSLLTCYAEFGEDSPRVWDPKRDGWFETEDLGCVTEAGVTVAGRASESVKVLGEIVHLARVEERLGHWVAGEPLLAGSRPDFAVLAVAHPRLGHELVLALASRDRERLESLPEQLRESLDSFANRALLPFERIRRVVWVDRIPRTPLGKCRRKLLALDVGVEPDADL